MILGILLRKCFLPFFSRQGPFSYVHRMFHRLPGDLPEYVHRMFRDMFFVCWGSSAGIAALGPRDIYAVFGGSVRMGFGRRSVANGAAAAGRMGLRFSERGLLVEGKQRKRNPMPEWAKQAPGVEVQVYRRRQDDRKRWEYLGILEPTQEVELDFLEVAHREELIDLIPWMEARELWGGGDFQFRFLWRDEEGLRKLKRSRDLSVAGQPRRRM